MDTIIIPDVNLNCYLLLRVSLFKKLDLYVERDNVQPMKKKKFAFQISSECLLYDIPILAYKLTNNKYYT